MKLLSPTERLVEDVASVYFGAIGVATKRGVEIDKAGERARTSQVTLKARFAAAVHRLNPDLSHNTIEEVVRISSRPPHPTLIQNNRWFHKLLTDGVDIEYHESNGRMRGGRARLVDFDNPAANDLLVLRQLGVAGASGKIIRPDLTVFLNGLPVALIELKDPTDTRANLGVAIDQIERYMRTAPDLFVSNLVLVVSDGMLTRVGSITSGHDRFMPWRPIDSEGGGAPTLEALIRGLFDLRTLVDYLRTCVHFEEDERGEVAKMIAGYHQFRAVRKARASVLTQLKPPSGTGDGRGGVIWHTQGSGKSLTMLMLAGGLIRESRMTNPTIVMITDRNDLDDQLFDTFAAGRALLREDPVQAASREHLRALLDRASGGVVFTTIFKFAEGHGVVSERSNVVVMADEAHRSQYGFVDGGARWMRQALPNATFVGFTGTPLEQDDRNTTHVFGEYAGRLRHPPSRRGWRYAAALLRVPRHQTEGGRGGCGRRRGTCRLRCQPRPQRRRGGGQRPSTTGVPSRSPGAHRTPSDVHRRTLGEASRRDGRQGDGGDHEPRHRRAALRGDPHVAPGLARRRRRKGDDEGGRDRQPRRSRAAQKACADQVRPKASGGAFQDSR